MSVYVKRTSLFKQKTFFQAAVETGRRRSSLIKVNEFSNFMKGIQEDYQSQGFEEKAALREMEDLQCRKPLPGSKSGTLKEKNDLIMKLVNTVEKKTDDIGTVSLNLYIFMGSFDIFDNL